MIGWIDLIDLAAGIDLVLNAAGLDSELVNWIEDVDLIDWIELIDLGGIDPVLCGAAGLPDWSDVDFDFWIGLNPAKYAAGSALNRLNDEELIELDIEEEIKLLEAEIELLAECWLDEIDWYWCDWRWRARIVLIEGF